MPHKNTSRFRGIWVIKDVMSKLVFAYPIKTESVETSKECCERFLEDLKALNPNKENDVTKTVR
eukprot:47286-Eustigmatos_ZCMA.PRE.1